MSLLKWLLIVTVAGYGCLLAAMYVFQRSLMYFPDATRLSPAQAGLPQAREVSLQSEDGEQCQRHESASDHASPSDIGKLAPRGLFPTSAGEPSGL